MVKEEIKLLANICKFIDFKLYCQMIEINNNYFPFFPDFPFSLYILNCYKGIMFSYFIKLGGGAGTKRGGVPGLITGLAATGCAACACMGACSLKGGGVV